MNITIFQLFNNLAGQNQFLDQVIIFLASYLPYLLIVAAMIFLFFHTDKKKLKEIFFVFIVALAAWLLANLLKNIIQTDRPYGILDNITKLLTPNDNFSFPSGHATFFAALATSLYLRHKKVGIIFATGALLIGLARIIGGIHFPIDILGGFVLGISLTLFINYFSRQG